jgi:AraC-like DNA-binding protein
MRRTHDKPVHVGAAWKIILRDLGIDEETVLKVARQPRGLFDGDGSYVGLDDLYALYAAVEKLSTDPTLALRTGSIVSIELFDPALFAAICSPDMNTAVRRLADFKRLVGAFELGIVPTDTSMAVTYRCKSRPDVPRLLGLSELVFLVAFARRATRESIRATFVEVQEMPEVVEPFEEFFGCSIRQADRYRLGLSVEDLKRPFLTQNSQMWDTFEPGLQRRMSASERAQSTASLVEDALFELLPSGRTQLTDVAEELAIGTRTLQRRLADEGTTWLDVLNDTRERLARHYLSTRDISVSEVSFLLGFEDPNSFFRAFRRWTGTTPENWRGA